MSSFRYPDFGVCNHTELYQLCRRAGIPVSPEFSNARLAKLLMNTQPNTEEVDNPIDSWRRALIRFVGARWDRLQNQVKCPLKSPDGSFNSDACFECLDMKVISCVVSNRIYERQIEELRK